MNTIGIKTGPRGETGIHLPPPAEYKAGNPSAPGVSPGGISVARGANHSGGGHAEAVHEAAHLLSEGETACMTKRHPGKPDAPQGELLVVLAGR